MYHTTGLFFSWSFHQTLTTPSLKIFIFFHLSLHLPLQLHLLTAVTSGLFCVYSSCCSRLPMMSHCLLMVLGILDLFARNRTGRFACVSSKNNFLKNHNFSFMKMTLQIMWWEPSWAALESKWKLPRSGYFKVPFPVPKTSPTITFCIRKMAFGIIPVVDVCTQGQLNILCCLRWIRKWHSQELEFVKGPGLAEG